VLESSIPEEWRTMLRLAGVAAGAGPDADIDALDDMVAADVAGREGVEADASLRGPERILDVMLRSGAHGLSLADLRAAPHGIDLGPLEPRLPDALKTVDGRVDLAPEPLVADVDRLHAVMEAGAGDGMVLIGRRDLRSNNSWMHNLPKLVSGPARCTAWVNPADASRLGLADGEPVRVSSRVGSVELPVEVTDEIMPGVVSIPHGWGHDAPGVRMTVASSHAGTNSNVLSDEELVEPLSGTAVLNGIPIEVSAVTNGSAAGRGLVQAEA
jgi:hypothetical protein